MPAWAWVLIGLVLLVPVLLLSPVVAPIALVVLITGVVGLAKGSRTWLRLKSRRAALGVTAVAAVVLLLTGSVSAAVLPRNAEPPAAMEQARLVNIGDQVAPEPTRTPRKSPRPTPTPVTTTRDETITEAIPFEQATAEDANLPRGQTAVTVAGRAGERTLTYEVTLVDGVESGRELTSDVVTVTPVAEVTVTGTYDAPPPAPAAPTCHPSYADACVPVASDVDCAWGTGDGPAYLDGVARVVGPDVYDLDRNNDGWACER